MAAIGGLTDWSRRNIAHPITAFGIVRLSRTMNQCTGE
jgi:hypothetical protein